VDETNETNNNAMLIFDFPVSVRTDKTIYALGETVNISIIGNGSDSIGVIYPSMSSWDIKFHIFKFENESWNEIIVNTPFYSHEYCENGTLYYALGDPIFRDCFIITVNSSRGWDQTQPNRVNLTCGNKTYNRWERLLVNPGIYKAGLYYIGYYYYSPYSFHQCSGDRFYAESNNFTILQNCSSNSNCAYGEKCINETCLQVQNYCENTSQCANNQICVNNTCSNLSCEYWQIAENSSCVLRYGYCENVDNCNFDQTCLNYTCQNISCYYWQIAINHSCVTASGYCKDGNDCSSGYYCSSHTCRMSSNSIGGTREINYTQPANTNATNATLKEFSGVPGEIEGLTITFNLGKDTKGAQVTATVGNKTSTATANDNGTVTITIPGFGQGEITATKTGFRTLTKIITVYAGTLNITKISGEKYGDEFKFKVTTKDGNPVKDANVEIYGQTLKTDAKGIVKTTIKTIQAGLEAFASKEDYKQASILFDIKAKGTLKISVPEKVKQGETITITVRDENKNLLPNANVSINGVEYTVDANGKIEYKVITTTLTLKASNDGYIPSEQTSVTVEAKIECGNGKCEAGETKENCLQDCIKCDDGYCDNGEDHKTCPSDCPKPEEFPWLLIILVAIMLLILVYFLIFRKNKKQ